MSDINLKHASISREIIKLFYQSYNRFSYGFNLNIYKNCFAAAIRNSSLEFEEDKLIDVYYEVDIIGQIQLDFIVDQKIIVLITANDYIDQKDLKRIYNYLKISPFDVGIVLNYGINPEHRRRDLSDSSQG